MHIGSTDERSGSLLRAYKIESQQKNKPGENGPWKPLMQRYCGGRAKGKYEPGFVRDMIAILLSSPDRRSAVHTFNCRCTQLPNEVGMGAPSPPRIRASVGVRGRPQRFVTEQLAHHFVGAGVRVQMDFGGEMPELMRGDLYANVSQRHVQQNVNRECRLQIYEPVRGSRRVSPGPPPQQIR